jgi:carbonic anhydrase
LVSDKDAPSKHAHLTPLLTPLLTPFSDPLDHLLAGNRYYAQRTTEEDPSAFVDLAKGQAPEVLWIGCADSRVPETTVCHCKPGEIFVHRNIANTVHPNDLNSASVVEYAVVHLKVKRVVVCGHTKCGGAAAALGDADLGETLNTWLHPVRE